MNAINHLIASLPSRERQRILNSGETVDLIGGSVLCKADQPFRHAYFPLTACICLVAITNGHRPLGLAMIGREGVLGATLALGVSTPRLCAVVHDTGLAWRVSAPRIRGLLRESPGLLRTLKRYSYVLMGQLLQTAACNSFHQVDMRLARWLLMTHDRTEADRFRLTHQMLADLLGVQRSAVTIAAGKLQDENVIAYARGHVRILSRSGLEQASCECYAIQRLDHAQQFKDGRTE